MKRYNIAPDEYLHIYNRGALKQPIFFNDRDRKRFLFLILFFQSSTELKNIDRMFKEFIQNPETYIQNQVDKLEDRYVELVAFCLMPNHFHLLIHELKEGGTAKYMQRVQNAYTKYINTKYQKSGHLLQGPYKAVRVEDNEQLLYLSSYIHKNPRELKEWKTKEVKFMWSSYQDFVIKNRWSNFLKHEIITLQFSVQNNKGNGLYLDFVKTSVAKEGYLE